MIRKFRIKHFKILNFLRNLFRNNFFSYKIILTCLSFFKISKEINPNNLIDKNTDFCLEGYPRSANSYLYFLINFLNPWIKIGGHTHTIANIKYSLKKRVPTFIIIRNPLDAISSFTLRRNETTTDTLKNSVALAINDYNSFYTYILRNYDKVFLLKFEDIVNFPLEILNLINSKIEINITVLKENEIHKMKNEVYSFLKRFDNQKRYKTSSIPNEKRKKELEHIKDYIKMQYSENLNYLDLIYKNILAIDKKERLS